MNKNTLTFILVIILGSAGMLVFYFVKPLLNKQEQFTISDSGKTEGSITIGIDNWVGYIPLCSKELRQRLHNAGLLLQCEDDQANYAERMKKLRAGKLDFAVATVDSFILNGAAEDFPGTIIMVIDESKGGDALLAHKSKLTKIEDLKSKKDWKIAFTPSSPSEHLLKAIGTHFDVEELRKKSAKWRIEVGGSQEARKKLENGEVDAAVLWEPDVSKALTRKEFIKLLGTEDTKNLIVDILLVNHQFAKTHPERVKKLLINYFQTLKFYRDNPLELSKEVEVQSKLGEAQVATMLKGVHWVSLLENARNWFGLNIQGKGQESLVNTIESSIEILMAHKDFKENPLPDRDFYRLQYRVFIEELTSELAQFGGQSANKDTNELSGKKFSALNDEQWGALTEVGSLKIRPISFQSGTSGLSDTGKAEIDLAIQDMLHYPNFRILVTGHTGLRGDKEANKQLSLGRSESVKKYLLEKHLIDGNRIRSFGYGSDRPLPRDIEEAERAYEYRLPRVEIKLLMETL
jgi:outer membrane protein OmpA-like peptidoglycan-associated protein/ABC-type taurine transport system substrate-binding protein